MVKIFLFTLAFLCGITAFSKSEKIKLHNKVSEFSHDTLLVGSFLNTNRTYSVSIFSNLWSAISFFRNSKDTIFMIGIIDSVKNQRIILHRNKGTLFTLYGNSFRLIDLDIENRILEIEQIGKKIKTNHFDLTDSFPNLSQTLQIEGDFKEVLGDIKSKKYDHYYLNFWATYCVPCIKHFSELPKFASYNTKVINVCAGVSDTLARRIITTKKPVGFNFYCEEEFVHDLNFEGGFPSGALYDRNGKLEYFYTAGVGDEVFKKLEEEKTNGK